MTLWQRIAAQSRYFLLWAGWRQPSIVDIESAVPMVPVTPLWTEWWMDLYFSFVKDGLLMPPQPVAFYSVRWYTAAFIPKRIITFTLPLNSANPYSNKYICIGGVWLPQGNAICLLDENVTNETVIRHEMTHALRQTGDHDPRYFNAKYGNYTGPQPL